MLKFISSSFSSSNVFNKFSTILRAPICYNSQLSLFNSHNFHCVVNKNLNKSIVILNVQRNMFIYRSGDMLWEGVTGPPGGAKKRARGKRRVVRNKVDLNFGRKIGEGHMHYKFPGLNAPILEVDSKMAKIFTGEKDEAYDAKIIDMRNKSSKRRVSRSVVPLKRGWSGSRLGGQSLGPPAPVLGQSWEGYDSRVLEMKVVSTMTGLKGRVGSFSALIMVGNGKGLAGIGKAKARTIRQAMALAKGRAINRFEYYELRDNRTLWHPDFIHAVSTKIYVKPMQEGYGLVCHRFIKTMCQLIGIKDMYAKVEGSTTNNQVMAQAFTALLRKQETYQDLANRIGLNVVETRSECDNYPHLLAAPNGGVCSAADPGQVLDFERLHVQGQVFRSKIRQPFYLAMPGPKHHARVRHKFRNQETVHRLRQVYEHLVDEGHFIKEKTGLD